METTSQVTTAFDELVALLRGRRIAVLTGAGISTESGIPDYRGPETRRRARNPIQYRAFVDDLEARTRYWARSAIGWTRFSSVAPNAGHHALARLEAAGHVVGVITQNVDGLHQRAGSERVVELHGALSDVRCLSCGRIEHRATLQRRLLALNPGWSLQSAELAPDGDAELAAERARHFTVPYCTTCDGVLKPDVVFFGESVPKNRVEAAWQIFEAADVLLVAGSSLAVYSGYRFVLKAARIDRPIGLVNLGSVRGQHLLDVHVDGSTGEVLPRLAEALMG